MSDLRVRGLHAIRIRHFPRSYNRTLADITGDAFFLVQVRKNSGKAWVRPMVIPYMVRSARTRGLVL